MHCSCPSRMFPSWRAPFDGFWITQRSGNTYQITAKTRSHGTILAAISKASWVYLSRWCVKLVRLSIKRAIQTVAIVIVFPAAMLTLFGRFKPVYTFFAHAFALGPGLPGSYLRAAYYKLTLSD